MSLFAVLTDRHPTPDPDRQRIGAGSRVALIDVIRTAESPLAHRIACYVDEYGCYHDYDSVDSLRIVGALPSDWTVEMLRRKVQT